MKKHTLFAVAALGLLFAGSTLLPGELSPVGSAYAKGGNGGGNGGGQRSFLVEEPMALLKPLLL